MSRTIRVALAGAVAALTAALVASAASAATVTFSSPGEPKTWMVPAGVTAATFDLYGAQGGSGLAGPGGRGGHARATIAITPGQSIQVNVGGQGLSLWEYHSGANGGGLGGKTGGGGGGASDIRIGGTTLVDRVLVAGGGGGGPNTRIEECEGWGIPGGGGGANGEDVLDPCGAVPSLVPPGGGTQTAGGAAGYQPDEYVSPGSATPGQFGQGGDGGYIPSPYGGGGGGGWYGGGGGILHGGGGGSGHGPQGTFFETGVRSGHGQVTITYDDPDEDDDGVLKVDDNCAAVANPDQRDIDRDGAGDLCDADDDNDHLSDEAEDVLGSSSADLDSDNDGLADGREDRNHNGRTGRRETNPTRFDTDGDGLGDGLERGLARRVANPPGPIKGTGRPFRPDRDPRSKTNPLKRDSDDGGVPDGREDKNRNGRIDKGETDPRKAGPPPRR